MRAEYINSFIKATSEVFKSITGVDLKMGPPFVKTNPYTANHVILMVGITGEIKGQAIISMSEETAKSIASAMMMGMPVNELDEMAKSAISELSNMIMGNSATLLYNDGVVVDITPPTFMLGDNLQISTSGMKTIGVPMDSEIGKITLNISSKE